MQDYIIFGLTVMFGLLGWLLARKDSSQEQQLKELKDSLAAAQGTIQVISVQVASALETALHTQKESQKLFELHDVDATALSNLRLQIASEHYHKKELDARFDKLDTTFREGFKDLGDRFDKFTAVLLKERHE